jgi:hypothetical protein
MDENADERFAELRLAKHACHHTTSALSAVNVRNQQSAISNPQLAFRV